MSLDSVLARYGRLAVTPVTADVTPGVTPKPAWIGACTPVTPVTPSFCNRPHADPAELEARALTDALIAAAMRRCDQFNDGQQARENMRRDCINTPDHLKPDLLRHFNEALRKPSDNQNRD